MMGIILTLYIKEKVGKVEFLTVLIASFVFSFFYLEPRAAIAGLIPIIAIYFFPNWKSKPTLFLGKISYSLYLIHPIFGAAVVNYLSHKVDVPFEKILVVLLGVFVAIVSAYFMYRFIEKPSQVASKKIKYTEKDAA